MTRKSKRRRPQRKTTRKPRRKPSESMKFRATLDVTLSGPRAMFGWLVQVVFAILVPNLKQ